LERLSRDTVSSPDALRVLRTPDRSEFSLPAPWKLQWEFALSGMRVALAQKDGTAAPQSDDPDQ
jgi:hypothetical protein